MALEMKGSCEKCGVTLTAGEVAYICSFEWNILRELRGADERRLSKLWRRTRATAARSRRLYFERGRRCLIR
jgi:ferredoxin